MTTVLNIFAVLTAFFGIYLGFQESVKGLAVNILSRFMDKEKINHTVLNICISVFIVALLTAWVSTGFSVVVFFQIGSPLYAIVSCLIPVYLVFRVAKLKKFKDWKAWCVMGFGILLLIAPFFKYLE